MRRIRDKTKYQDVISLIFSSAGVTGVFVVVGFIVDVAFQERLGFQMPSSNTVAWYLSVCGTFFFETFELISAFIVENTWTLIGFCFIIIISYFLLKHKVRTLVSGIRNQRFYLIIATISFLVVKIFFLDLPTFQVQDILVDAPPSPPGFVSSILWQDQVCSRIDSTQQHSNNCNSNPEFFRKRRTFIYLADALFFLASLAILASTVRGGKGLNNNTSIPMIYLLQIVCIFNILLFPYVYAKTVKSTSFREIIWSFNVDTTAAEQSNQHGFILSQNSSDIVLFTKTNDIILVLQRATVGLIAVEGNRDVYEYYLRKIIGRKKNAPYLGSEKQNKEHGTSPF